MEQKKQLHSNSTSNDEMIMSFNRENKADKVIYVGNLSKQSVEFISAI
jgi:hypothetical protein